MQRLAPLLITLIVSTVDVAYGRFAWSWLAGPIAGLTVWALGAAPRHASTPAPLHTGRVRTLVD